MQKQVKLKINELAIYLKDSIKPPVSYWSDMLLQVGGGLVQGGLLCLQVLGSVKQNILY